MIALISIPLSILTSIVVLHFVGHTLNTMTLGGMALAVGTPVDDSAVTIENTHWLRGEGMNLAAATLHGSARIAVPTMVSTLAISYVFTSVVFLEGRQNFFSRRARGRVRDAGVRCALADVDAGHHRPAA